MLALRLVRLPVDDANTSNEGDGCTIDFSFTLTTAWGLAIPGAILPSLRR